MAEINSFRDVIELWPSRQAMASDVPAPASTVSKWWQRDSIPSEWWSSVLNTDTAKSNEITSDKLTVLAARETAEAR